MPDGFYVDIAALRSAADGIITTMDEMATMDVESTVPSAGSVGHDEFAGRLQSFGVRWQIGVTNLMKDVDAVATSLAEAVSSYLATDEARASGFEGVLERVGGDDPAAS